MTYNRILVTVNFIPLLVPHLPMNGAFELVKLPSKVSFCIPQTTHIYVAPFQVVTAQVSFQLPDHALPPSTFSKLPINSVFAVAL